MTGIVSAIISALASVVVALIAGRMNKALKKNTADEEKRQKALALQLECTRASMELSEACCNALCGGRNNGNVKVAQQRCAAVKKAFEDFEKDLVTEVLR